MIDRYATLRNGLVGAWCPSLGARAYTLLDRSGRNNHGTLVNTDSTVWSGNESGISLNLDGTNDFVRVPNTAAITPTRSVTQGLNFTWATWVRAPNANQFGVIAQMRMADGGITNVVTMSIGEDTLNGTSGKKIGIGLLFSSLAITRWYDTSSDVVNGQWLHVAATVDDNATRLYVNGVSQSLTTRSSVGTPVTLAPTGPLRIGTNVESGGNFLTGRVDDFRIYNRALTASEVLILASRRGIGLVPTRHRRASLLSQFWTKVSGTWKTATPWINVGGTWKKGTPKLRTGGAWKG